jgi:bisphosphoglycerate-independent phosphoglycerate mutase (AlkP superfamily)
VMDPRLRGKKLAGGRRLADLAPTALQIMGHPTPQEMTGKSLVDG